MPGIHVYTVMWNEEVLLPYFLRHYGSFATRIVCFDNMSTDRSAQIVDSHPLTERVQYDTNGQIVDTMYLELKGRYRQSRGTADWVMCVDIDEFIYHPQLAALLADYTRRGITYPKVQGFEMIAEQPPSGGSQIYEEIRDGRENEWSSKRVVFDPALEVVFEAGCHRATVSGNVVESENADIRLLHYPFLGRDFFIERSRQRRARLSEENKKFGWGDYEHPDSYFADVYDEVKTASRRVL
jgi:hypothetical protein